MAGASLDRAIGLTVGAETVTLDVSQMPAHVHTGTTGSAGTHSHTTGIYGSWSHSYANHH